MVKKIIKEGVTDFSSYDASDTPSSYIEYPSQKEVAESDLTPILKKYNLLNNFQTLQGEIQDLNGKIHDICNNNNGYFGLIHKLVDNLIKDVKDEKLIDEILIKFYTVYIDGTIDDMMTKEGFLNKFN